MISKVIAQMKLCLSTLFIVSVRLHTLRWEHVTKLEFITLKKRIFYILYGMLNFILKLKAFNKLCNQCVNIDFKHKCIQNLSSKP